MNNQKIIKRKNLNKRNKTKNKKIYSVVMGEQTFIKNEHDNKDYADEYARLMVKQEAGYTYYLFERLWKDLEQEVVNG